MYLMEAFAQFKNHQLNAFLFSEKTINGYYWVLHSFYLCHGDIPVGDVTKEKVAEWIDFMQNKGNSRSTIICNLNRFKMFAKYLEYENLSPIKHIDVPSPKPASTIPKYVDSGQIKTMIDKSNNLRDSAIVSTLFCTGMRNSELRNLRKTDISGRDVYLEEGKGLKDRFVRLDVRSKHLVTRYLNTRTDGIPYVFKGRNGQMSKSTLTRIVRTSASNAGLESVCVHTIRHSCATHMLRSGANIRVIQEYLGHSGLTTTQLYTHMSNHDIIRSHREAFDDDQEGTPEPMEEIYEPAMAFIDK